MASYVVMEPPSRGEGGEAVLVRDGFHALAFLLPFVWLLWHRLWIEALVALAVAVALGLLGSAAGFGNASSVLSLLVAILIGLEGVSLRLAALRRRGWREWGVVEAENPRDAEIRYLAEAHGEVPADGPWRGPDPSSRPARRAASPALGLFSYPGRG